MKGKILKLLLEHQGEYVSGEHMSDRLGISRTAVWKHINSIKKEGYPVVSSPKRGYRLEGRPDILNAQEITLGLDTQALGQQVYLYDQADSTNEIIKKLGNEGKPEGVIAVAEQQSGGKGRLGRQWISPQGVGLWFSLLLRPALKPYLAPQLSLVCAAAVCRALRNFTGLDVTIKWPNDLLLEGKKICGILTELSAEIDQINYVVVGIGINVNQDEDDFAPEIKSIATSLATKAGRKFRRVELLRAVLTEVERVYLEYLAQGFSKILLQWREFCSTLGQEVTVIAGKDEQFYGLAVDIDEYGQLLVRKADGEVVAVIAGDVSVRSKKIRPKIRPKDRGKNDL